MQPGKLRRRGRFWHQRDKRVVERFENRDSKRPAWVIHVDRVEKLADDRGCCHRVWFCPMGLSSVDVELFGEIGERAIGHRHVDEH
jgi:hypothetical protein